MSLGLPFSGLAQQQISWNTTSGNTDWFNKDNWSPKQVPGQLDKVTISKPIYTIYIKDSDAYVDELQVGGGSTLLGPALEIQNATLYVGTRLTLAGSKNSLGSLVLDDATATVIGGPGAELIVGKDGWGQAFLYSGARMVFDGGVTLGGASTSVGVMEITGKSTRRSVLETAFLAHGASNSKYTRLTISGGELKATRNEDQFLRNFSSGFLNIGKTGMWINSNGYNIGVDETNFLSGDGALFKIGQGTLTLTASGTQKGGITIKEGAVAMRRAHFTSETGTLVIGPNAGDDAKLVMEDGAQASYRHARIGYDSGSKGEMILRGNETLLSVNDTTGADEYNLILGHQATAHVSLESGAKVQVSRWVDGVDVGGTVGIAMGSVSVATLDFGSADLNAPTTTGTLEARELIFGYNIRVGAVGKGLVRFNQTDALTLTLNVLGLGNMVQRGTGKTTLTGNIEKSISLRVEDGTLNIEGSAAGMTTVVGGTLGGSGTLGSVTLSGGRLSPGNSPGTMSIGKFLWNGGEIVADLGHDLSGSDLLQIGQFVAGAPRLWWTFEDNGWQVGETYDLFTLTTGTADPTLFGFTNGGGFDGEFAFNGDTLQFTLHAIPEPASLGLIAIALLLGLQGLKRACV